MIFAFIGACYFSANFVLGAAATDEKNKPYYYIAGFITNSVAMTLALAMWA